MTHSKRPPKDELLSLLHLGTECLAKRYTVSKSTVYSWFRFYGVKPDGTPKPGKRCGNPDCDKLTGDLVKGRCPACRMFVYYHGRDRTKAEMNYPAGVFCRRCKESGVYALGLCQNCYQSYRNTGRSRPWHIIHKGPCVCGAPYEKGKFRKGKCHACRAYTRRTGKPRPPHLWTAVPLCDCGHKATHFDVRLQIRTGEGNVKIESYNLCDDCYQYANE